MVLIVSLNAETLLIPAEKNEIVHGYAHKDLVSIYRGKTIYESTIDADYDGWIGRRFRVSFLLSEIYYSLIIDEIEHNDTKRPREYIKNSYFVNGFELSRKLDIPHKRITSLDFIDWKSKTEFKLKANSNIQICIEITKDENDSLLLKINKKKI